MRLMHRDNPSLFDHLIGGGKERLRDRKPQGFCGLEPQRNHAPHQCSSSITSSASASRFAGMLMPSVFAVLRLMTKIVLVGDCTGSSPGSAPLRTRSI